MDIGQALGRLTKVSLETSILPLGGHPSSLGWAKAACATSPTTPAAAKDAATCIASIPRDRAVGRYARVTCM